MNIKKTAAMICVLAALSADAANVFMFVPLKTPDGQSDVAPGGWFAPWRLIAACPDGGKVSSAVFSLNGIDRNAIEGVSGFIPPDGEDDLLYFPMRGKEHKGKITVSDTTMTVEFPEPFAVSGNVGARPTLLFGVNFSNNLPEAPFSIKLEGVKYGTRELTVNTPTVEMKRNDVPPPLELTCEKISHPLGVDGWKLTLKTAPASQLAFEPGIAVQLKGLDTIMFNRWNQFFRTTELDKVEDGTYELVWPELALLSGNDLPMTEKSITYACDPQPDQWGFRSDITGHDLFDNDPRSGHVARPGGLQWNYTKQVRFVIDLKKTVRLGGVSLFVLQKLNSFSVAVAESPDGPWSEPVEMSCDMSRPEKYGPRFNLAVFNLFFDEFKEGRYIRLVCQCDHWFLLTEIMFWGQAEGAKVYPPGRISAYVTGKTGINATKHVSCK